MGKYKNHSITVDNLRFDSIREAKRYKELMILFRAGAISDLQCQVKYELIPKQNGERSITYIADFVYKDREGNKHVEDVKGCRTQVYILKRKLMLWVRGIRIEEK